MAWQTELNSFHNYTFEEMVDLILELRQEIVELKEAKEELEEKINELETEIDRNNEDD